MAHRHVPSRQELLSRPWNIPGYQEWKNSATPRAWRSCGVTGSASVSRSPKASALQFRGSKQRTGRLLPALAIQGTARHGKHMYPLLSATSPSARRQMLCSRAPPAISNTTRLEIDRSVACSRSRVPSLFPDRSTCSSRLAILRSGSSTLRSQASERSLQGNCSLNTRQPSGERRQCCGRTVL